MPRPQVRWYRIFAVYFVLAAACLIAAACTKSPLHDILLTLGVCLGAGFVPLVMAIYFVRGFRGNP